MTSTKKKHKARRGKATSLRNRLRARSVRPRLSVFRSLTNISVQVIDDLEGKTLASASSLEKDVRGAIDGMNKTDVAKKVGALLGERLPSNGCLRPEDVLLAHTDHSAHHHDACGLHALPPPAREP